MTGEIINHRGIWLPTGALKTLDEETFCRHMIWESDKSEISRIVIKRFENAAKSHPGYTDRNRPAQPYTENSLKIGNDFEFQIQTSHTTKTPAYEQVVAGFEKFLDLLVSQWKQGIRREGIRTIGKDKKEPYADASILKNELESRIEESKSGKEGISQTLKVDKSPEIKVPNVFSILYDKNYDIFTQSTALDYLTAGKFIEEGDERDNPFMGILYQDALKLLGSEPKEGEIKRIKYPFERNVFLFQLEGRSGKTSYAKIIDRLRKPLPEKLTKRAVVGDFVKAEMCATEEGRNRLEKYGLFDEDFVAAYNPSPADEKTFVRLYGVKSKIDQYFKDATPTKPTIEKNLIMMPSGYA